MSGTKSHHSATTRTLQAFFLACTLLLIIFNTFTLYRDTRSLGQIRKRVPFAFTGNIFMGLDSILTNVDRIGYYTDKDLDVNQDALQFAQAQYILAPIILELNNTNLLYVLFDCTNDTIALQKIKEAGLIAIKKNQFGIILAGNPKAIKKSKPQLPIPLWNNDQSRKPIGP